MQELKCPHCNQVFSVDDAAYAAILEQIRGKEFELEINKREKGIRTQLEAEQKLALKAAQTQASEEAEKLKQKITELEASQREAEQDHKLTLTEAIAEKEKTIAVLREELSRLEEEQKRELEAAIIKKEADSKKEVLELKHEIEMLETAIKTSVQTSEQQQKIAVQNAISELQIELEKSKSARDKAESEHRLELERQQHDSQQIIAALNSQLEQQQIEAKAALSKQTSEIEAEHQKALFTLEAEKKRMQEQIDYYKDLKARLSTKMVGESLEQHCQIQFDSLRPTAFRNATFEKDNDASGGSKGDFIYRDYDENGNEFISIMFEMKNEMDETATKHKNEDFFKKLDKDRNDKKCEYAVLVSLLESDNEYYNNGIVDVSHKYKKMYVIRPQFFIPIITLLRNAAEHSLEYRKKLEIIQNQNLDISHFEEDLQTFQSEFSRNYQLASQKFETAIQEIDKTIEHLEKVKKNLMSSENNLRLATKKAEDLTVKKLTKKNPTMRKMFEDLKNDQESE